MRAIGQLIMYFLSSISLKTIRAKFFRLDISVNKVKESLVLEVQVVSLEEYPLGLDFGS